MQKITTRYFKFFFLVLLVLFPIFGNLNVQPIRIWDESRLAINAYQMCQDNDWIVTHYWDNHPDMWNTKPPLLIWCQVFFMKLLGIGELAMRLPSAIAAFLTCLVLLILSIRYLKDFMFGFIAVLVLITTYGYINAHAVRTGDYDSLLTFFTTISAIAFFAYTENRRSRY
jgi:4-amino-4-deoxy-L-arabinose transferase-like glycosyltransferase